MMRLERRSVIEVGGASVLASRTGADTAPLQEIRELMVADGFRLSFAGGRVQALPLFQRRVIPRGDGKWFAHGAKHDPIAPSRKCAKNEKRKNMNYSELKQEIKEIAVIASGVPELQTAFDTDLLVVLEGSGCWTTIRRTG
jgi:hypothetical protein